MTSRDLVTHRGGCHCGRVRFEITAGAHIEVIDCNCSMCRKLGYLHWIVPKTQLKLVSGSEWLTTYEFNTRTAKHLFCAVCGIKSFYVPRSHPNDYSVNVRCLDEGSIATMKVVPFDGTNWEQAQSAARLGD